MLSTFFKENYFSLSRDHDSGENHFYRFSYLVLVPPLSTLLQLHDLKPKLGQSLGKSNSALLCLAGSRRKSRFI
jgi:hypothetical protein